MEMLGLAVAGTVIPCFRHFRIPRTNFPAIEQKRGEKDGNGNAAKNLWR
jgi:hypothetical protein